MKVGGDSYRYVTSYFYHIALIFRGSKFLRISVCEKFIEIILQMRRSNMPRSLLMSFWMAGRIHVVLI